MKTAIGAFACMVGLAGLAGGGDLPRYRLKVGQELTYRSITRNEGKRKAVYTVDWKVWPIAVDADGATRLVLRCDLKMATPATNGGKPDEDLLDTILWTCKLYDDGRLVGAQTMGTVRDPFRLFPRLPDDAAKLAAGWEYEAGELESIRMACRLEEPIDHKSRGFHFVMNGTSPADKVYDSRHVSRCTFDPMRGLVIHVETEDETLFGGSGVSRGTIELVSVEDRGPSFAESLRREADVYFAAIAAYDESFKRAEADVKGVSTILAQSKTKLEAAASEVDPGPFRTAIAAKLKSHEASARYAAVQGAEARAKRIGSPAGDWEVKDLDGKTHHLADYRGKVVVLDFWYRGCGWCMHAMPQVNRLSESFRGQPVVVLAMSIDKDEKDARIVRDAMKLGYPVLRAEEVATKYGVQGYPTMFVIGPDGVFREMHVGYSPKLFDELSTVIRGLLPRAGR